MLPTARGKDPNIRSHSMWVIWNQVTQTWESTKNLKHSYRRTMANTEDWFNTLERSTSIIPGHENWLYWERQSQLWNDQLRWKHDQGFPWETQEHTDTAIAPAGDGLFNQSQGGRVPTEQRAEVLHTMVVKDYSLCTNSKHARPDVQPTIPVLYTMMKGPTGADWVNLPDCWTLSTVLRRS